MKTEENLEFIEAAQKIKEGNYFSESLSWYDAKYNSPMAERSYLIVIMIISCLIIYYAYQAISGILPLEERYEAVVYQNDIDNYSPRIIPLANKYGYTDDALIEFHAKDYVIARESYIIEDFEKNFYRTRALSDPEIFKTYRAFLEPTNPESPIALYGRTSSRSIFIESYTPIKSSTNADDKVAFPDGAEIRFSSVVKNQQGESITSNFLAKLKFSYKKVEVNQETYEIKPMEFIVTDYNIEQIIGSK